jgi:hypothetical protein
MKFAEHSGRVFRGIKCFCPLEHWDRGLESHLSMDVCVYSLFVLSCVGSGFATG